MEDLIQKIGSESVWAAILVSGLVWFMKTIAQPLTARHIQFMDTFENRDREKTEIIGSLSNNLIEFRKTQEEHLEICRSGNHPRPIHKPA